MYCNSCKTDKQDIDFNWKHKNLVRASKCKACSKLYAKKHYQANKQEYLKRAKYHNEHNAHHPKVVALKASLKANGCAACAETDTSCLDFHHIDEKIENIGMLRSMKKILVEVKKCIVLCANCHRKYHYGRKDIIALVDKLAKSVDSKSTSF